MLLDTVISRTASTDRRTQLIVDCDFPQRSTERRGLFISGGNLACVNETRWLQVTKPLIRWFQTKSKLCRELEVQAIRESVAAEKRDTAEERRKRLAEDAAWMAAVTTAIPPLSPPPHVDEEEQVQFISCERLNMSYVVLPFRDLGIKRQRCCCCGGGVIANLFSDFELKTI